MAKANTEGKDRETCRTAWKAEISQGQDRETTHRFEISDN